MCLSCPVCENSKALNVGSEEMQWNGLQMEKIPQLPATLAIDRAGVPDVWVSSLRMNFDPKLTNKQYTVYRKRWQSTPYQLGKMYYSTRCHKHLSDLKFIIFIERVIKDHCKERNLRQTKRTALDTARIKSVKPKSWLTVDARTRYVPPMGEGLVRGDSKSLLVHSLVKLDD